MGTATLQMQWLVTAVTETSKKSARSAELRTRLRYLSTRLLGVIKILDDCNLAAKACRKRIKFHLKHVRALYGDSIRKKRPATECRNKKRSRKKHYNDPPSLPSPTNSLTVTALTGVDQIYEGIDMAKQVPPLDPSQFATVFDHMSGEVVNQFTKSIRAILENKQHHDGKRLNIARWLSDEPEVVLYCRHIPRETGPNQQSMFIKTRTVEKNEDPMRRKYKNQKADFCEVAYWIVKNAFTNEFRHKVIDEYGKVPFIGSSSDVRKNQTEKARFYRIATEKLTSSCPPTRAC